jgi:hypothetical protein
MALKESTKANDLSKDVKFDLKATNLRDFENEIAKIKILETAYNHIKGVSPVEAISFSLSFGLDW